MHRNRISAATNEYNSDELMSLEKIELRGYKSIRELKPFPLDRGINLLIGANGSGKSNFIKFFEMLGHMMDPNKGLQNYVSSRGRADAFLFRGMQTTPELHAHLWFGLNQYEFTLRGAADRSLFFSSELAPFEGPLFGNIYNSQGTGHLESGLISKKTLSKSERWVVNTIQDWRLYHFHDTSPSAPVMGVCNIVDNKTLHGNAGNLAAFLMEMSQTKKESFNQIVETVRQVAPFFGEFDLRDISKGQTQLLWKDRYSDLVYYPHQISDGTLRYICLATLLLQPNPPSTIIIDEPELGLHPYAIKLLASLLHEAARKVQLIVSTQSSLLLDEIAPENVVVVNHRGGETTLERQDPAHLKEWLKEYTLGQLWEKNELGGIP